jgi:hypothetical protein
MHESFVAVVGKVVFDGGHSYSYLSHRPNSRHFPPIPGRQQFLVVLVLRLHAANEAEDARDGRLWQRLEDSQDAGMGTRLRGKVDVAVPTHKRTSEEISPIEGEDQLRPSSEGGGFEGYLKGEVPHDLLSIGGSHLTNKVLFSIETCPVDAVDYGAECCEGVVFLEDSAFDGAREGDE